MMERGYIPSGKDRQHAVDGQPYGEAEISLPQTWSNPGTLTWYQTVSSPMVLPPMWVSDAQWR